MVDEEEKPKFRRAMSMIGEDRTKEVAMESSKDFEDDVDPQELRMKITDQVVSEVVVAVERHSVV